MLLKLRQTLPMVVMELKFHLKCPAFKSLYSLMLAQFSKEDFDGGSFLTHVSPQDECKQRFSILPTLVASTIKLLIEKLPSIRNSCSFVRCFWRYLDNLQIIYISTIWHSSQLPRRKVSVNFEEIPMFIQILLLRSFSCKFAVTQLRSSVSGDGWC